MSNYSNTFGGATKDTNEDTILGAEFDTQFENIATMSGTKADKIGSATSGNVVTMDTTGNLTDSGVTFGSVTTAELAVLHGLTATTTELNKLDGVTVTPAEINILKGTTATTADLNQIATNTSDIATLQSEQGSFVGYDMKVYTSSGVWTKPTDLRAVKVTVIGGGQGGYNGTYVDGNSTTGATGVAGGTAIDHEAASGLGATVTVTVGSGGSTNGGTGGTSSFGTYAVAGPIVGTTGDLLITGTIYPTYGSGGAGGTGTFVNPTGTPEVGHSGVVIVEEFF